MNQSSLLRRPFRFVNWNVSIVLVVLNVLVFFLTYVRRDAYPWLAMIPAAVLQGRVWQVFTYMFVHADLTHILVNMFGLFMFGQEVERRMGSKEFLLFYLLTGTLAGLLSLAIYVLTGAYGVFLMGASGALFAVMLAFATIYPEARIMLYGLVPVKASVMVLGYTAIEIFSQAFGVGANVAHLTHLGGFLFAWAYFMVRFGVNPLKRFFPR